MANYEPKTRKRVITIRHPTPSRRKIVVIVAQSQDVLGNWLTPLITFEGPVHLIMESGRYARDVGIGLVVAAYFYDEFMLRVKGAAADLGEQIDMSIEDE